LFDGFLSFGQEIKEYNNRITRYKRSLNGRERETGLAGGIVSGKERRNGS
jgi:hypothetical protein